MTDEAVAALEEARRMGTGAGDAPVLSAGTDLPGAWTVLGRTASGAGRRRAPPPDRPAFQVDVGPPQLTDRTNTVPGLVRFNFPPTREQERLQGPAEHP